MNVLTGSGTSIPLRPVAAAAAPAPARRGPVGDSVRDEEYDIPTFLRRGAE